ncbi:MAG: DUF4489 domain-containing protein [Oscillospiraceae bacterium]|nr:DUF4489 domain-containing protein [Oscillospiraceae bacterium]
MAYYPSNSNTVQNADHCYANNSCPGCPDNSGPSPASCPGVILNCGSGSAGPLPIMDLAGASIINPYSVASVTLNTKNLKNPSVLITFTGLISVPVGVLPNISFRLKKSCNGASQAIGGSYNYSSAVDALHSETFSFQVCDCGECCDCVTYTVEISNATLAQAGTTVSGTVSAIAVNGGCGCS